jgi:hypothetical protein
MRRIGVLMSTAVDDPQDPSRHAAFAQGLQELGWTIGSNLRSAANKIGEIWQTWRGRYT